MDRRFPPTGEGGVFRREQTQGIGFTRQYRRIRVRNPPFGKKSAITVINDEGETDKESITYNRPDFWTTTSNKQLNFVQHVKSMLQTLSSASKTPCQNGFTRACPFDRVSIAFTVSQSRTDPGISPS